MSVEDDNKKDSDLFIANATYPEAEPIFTARLKPLDDIKSDCFVVLDTNALLVPYTTSKESLEQIRRTCKALATENRLIIPGQVAREFAKNRAKKIGELYQQLSAKRDSAPAIQKGMYPLLESLEEYKNSLRIEDEINKLLREYREAVGKVLDHIQEWAWDDPVSLLYGELFTSSEVMDISINEEEMKKEHARRKLNNIPPGYKDSGIGDLLIWFTILEIGKTHKKSLIFVSGDEKTDWYHISNKKPLYPRYELVDEYRRNSGGQSFHIIQFSRFLDLYGASESVVEEVRKEEIQIALEPTKPSNQQRIHRASAVEAAVFRWLQGLFFDNVSYIGVPSRVDCIVSFPDGTSMGVEVKYFRNIHEHAKLRLVNTIIQLRAALEQYTNIMLVLVAADVYTLNRLNTYIDELDTSDISFTIGILNESGEFEALRSTPIHLKRQPH
jgi:rRNA-processing protein FCF1